MFSIKTRLLNQSLARKLTAISLAAGEPAIIIAAILIMAYDGSTSRQRLVRDTSMLADVVGANSTAALTFGDAQAAKNTLRAVSVNEHIVSAALFLNDGTLFARFDREQHGRAAGPPAANDRRAQPTPTPTTVLPVDTESVRTHGARERFVPDSLLVTRPIMLDRIRSARCSSSRT